MVHIAFSILFDPGLFSCLFIISALLLYGRVIGIEKFVFIKNQKHMKKGRRVAFLMDHSSFSRVVTSWIGS